MIKFLTSIFLIFFVFSCKELQKKQTESKITNGFNIIEDILDKKEDQNINEVKGINKKNNTIYYYLEDPYYIQGVKYVPEENYNYSEIGISTFYGKELHNVKTVNNDLNKVTELLGRHKTLPIPSMVKITNLDNGLSMNIKIVDRHNDNTVLIQVSRKVAQLLGFYKEKIATVKVEILSDASKQWKNVSLSLNEPQFNDTISSAPTEIVSISNIDNFESESKNSEISEPIEIFSEQIDDFKLFLKISKFKNYNELKVITDTFANDQNFTSEKNGSYYDLILGPIDKTEINDWVMYFISKGYKETKIILN